MFITHEPKAGDHPPPPPHTETHTHTCKYAWPYKTSKHKGEQNADAVCFYVLHVELNCFVLQNAIKTFYDDK